MVTVNDIRPGHGLHWKTRGGQHQFGVAVFNDGGAVRVAAVQKITSAMRCYDDKDAVRRRDKDNVRLRGCPPPFSSVSKADDQCYAVADLDNLLTFDNGKLSNLGVEIIDGGIRVNERTMEDILDHPWRDVPEKQAAGGRTSSPGRIYGRPMTVADKRAAQAVAAMGEGACGLTVQLDGTGGRNGPGE